MNEWNDKLQHFQQEQKQQQHSVTLGPSTNSKSSAAQAVAAAAEYERQHRLLASQALETSRKLDQLQNENARLKEELANARDDTDAARMALEDQRRKLQDEKRRTAEKLRRADEMAQQSLLAVEAKFHRQMAESDAKTSQIGVVDPVRELIGNVEELQARLDTKVRQWEQERSTLWEDRRQAELSLKRDHESALSNLKRQVMAQEDSNVDLTNKNAQIKAENNLLRNKETELKTRLTAITRERDSQVRSLRSLQEEIEELKKDGSTGGIVTGSRNDEIEALQAASIAKTRQLTNEIEYVRSELAGAEKHNNELSRSLQVVTAQCERAKGECKTLAKEYEAARRKQVQELQAKFQHERDTMEDKRKEVEDQMNVLKLKLTEMHNELDASKKREEKAQAEAQENADERDQMEDTVINLKRQLADGHSDKSEGTNGTANGLALSNQQRRISQLENELTFIKNTLASEREQHQDMEGLLSSQRQRHAGAVDDLKAVLKDERTKYEDLEEEFNQLTEKARDDQSALDHTVKHLSAQLAAAHEQANNLREQHRQGIREIEEREKENLTIRAELERERRERQEERDRIENSASSQRRAMDSIKEVVSNLEAQKALDTSSLKAQLAAAHSEVSTVQQRSLAVQQKADKDRRQQQRENSTRLLTVVLQGWLRARIRSGFRSWREAAKIGKIQDDLLSQHQKKMAAANNSARISLQAMQDTLEQSHRNTLQQIGEQHTRESKALSEKLVSEKAEELIESHRQEVEEIEDQNRLVLATSLAKQREHLQMLAADQLSEAQRKIDLLAQAKEDALGGIRVAHDMTLARQQEEQEQVISAFKTEAEAAKTSAVANAIDKAKIIHEQQLDAALESVRKDLTKLHEAKQAQAILSNEQKLRAAYEEQIKKLEHQSKLNLESAVAAAQLQAEKNRKEALEQQAKYLEEQKQIQIKAGIEKETKILRDSLTKQAEAAKMQREKEVSKIKEERDKRIAEADVKINRLSEQVQGLRAEDKALRQQLEDTSNNLNVKHAAAITELHAQHVQALQDQNSQNQAAQAKLATELMASHDLAVKQQQKQHDEAVRALQAEAKKQLDVKMSQAREETAKMCALLEKDKADALAKAAETSSEKLAQAEIAWHEEADKHMMSKLQAAELAKQNAVRDIEEDAEADMQDRVLELEQEMKAEKQRAMQELKTQQEQMQQQILQEKERALVDLEERMERQQRVAMDELRGESEQLIRDFEDVIAGVREEKSDLEVELEDARNAIEEAEDMAYDLQQQLNQANQAGAAMRLRCIIAMVQGVGAAKRVRDQETRKLRAVVARMDQLQRAALDRMASELESAQDRASQLDEVKLKMQDTLVNHKRDVLMQHKVQSTAIQSDLNVLAKQKVAKAVRVKNLQDDMGMLKGSLTTIENEIREISQRSALSNGGEVNVEMLQKKRRLNKDLDDILDKISSKQKQLRMAKEQLADVEEQEQEKTEDLKDLETNLVQVLMEQQKKMLTVVGSVAKASSSLKVVNRFKNQLTRDSQD